MSEIGNMTIGLRGVSVAENMLKLQVAALAPEATSNAEVELYLDDTKLTITEVTTFLESGESISYAVIVDVSGSMKETQMTEMKETLLSLISNMRECDRMNIILMGNDVTASGFTGDREALQNAVESLEIGHEDTNLYYAVDKALSLLEADTVKEHLGKCLVVISDGADEQVTGITLKEVESHIEKARIPVYTVAVSFDETDTLKTESAKILGSFARLSPAGFHQVLGANGLTAEEAGTNIVSLMQNSMIVTADVSGFTTQKAETYLELVTQQTSYGTAKDGYIIPAATITKGQIAKTGENSAGAETSAEVESSSGKETISEGQIGSGETLVESQTVPATAFGHGWLGFGIGILLLIVIAGILWKKKFSRKAVQEKSEEADLEEAGLEDADLEDADLLEGTEPVVEPGIESFNQNRNKRKRHYKGNRSVNRKGPKIKKSTKRTLTLLLISADIHSDEQKQIVLVEDRPYILGRAQEDAPESMKQNRKVSGSHVRLVFHEDKLYMEDLGSTNGSLVNGVPIHGAYRLSSDDRISLGGSEWRIKIL